MNRYNPMSYHNGSIWPHDNAVIAAGLARYGFIDDACHIAEGIFEASTAFGGHLPELFCGFDRAEFAGPIAYPAACTPQAWSSASAFSLVRTLLGLDCDLPEGRVQFAPHLPGGWEDLRLDQLAVGDSRVAVDCSGPEPVVSGLPERISLIGARRGDGPQPTR
jgi:glycogen debranching enzyme